MKETYVIHVTKQCNCNCRYCYETDKTSTYTWEEIKVLLDGILANAPERYDIEFLGGEPTLAMDLIEKTIDYTTAETYVITTNGTIVNDQLISLLKRGDVIWAASMDGNHVANSLRTLKDGTNTCDLVMENYHKLKAVGVTEDRTLFHIVTHHFNIGYLVDSVRFLFDHGVRFIGVGTIESVRDIDEEYCHSFRKRTKELARLCRSGAFPGLQINEFENMKPRSDQRTYMRDANGKMIGESYGRAGDDVTQNPPEGVTVSEVGSPFEKTICDLREEAYRYYNSFDRHYGCGTGRSASKSLAKYLNAKHEPLDLPWGFTEEGYKRIVNCDFDIVQAGILPYAQALMERGYCFVTCVERKKEDFIQSFMRAHRLERNADWIEMPNAHQYPAYSGSVQDGLAHYWTVYNDEALRLSRQFEDQFSYLSFETFTRRANSENS